MPPSPHYEGCFAGPDFILMAHPCYRRGMQPVNNRAPRFVDLFWHFDGPGIEKYIAIDEDRVRIDVDGLGYFEADTWYGAPFDGEVRNIKPGIAKLRPPMDIESRYVSFLFADAYCLDIKWSESDHIKSFQALDIKTEDIRIEIGGQHYFPPATCTPSLTSQLAASGTSTARSSFSRKRSISSGGIPIST